MISEAAVVQGEIHADHVIINGTVRGPVHARELLELQPKARIEGDVYYKALEMHQGAIDHRAAAAHWTASRKSPYSSWRQTTA